MQADRCDSPQTQAEMNTCAALKLARRDQRLNVAYSKLMKTVDPHRRTKLRAAQRAWLAFRDAECAFEASESEGGTMYPLLFDSCKTELTKARVAELKQD